MIRCRATIRSVGACGSGCTRVPDGDLSFQILMRRRKITATAVDGAVSRTAQEIRSRSPLRDHTHRGACARTSRRRPMPRLRAGHYRGPLHGIPWGAKDLLAVKGYKTTWGAGPYKEQLIDEDATVVKRLDAAGAILVAKLSLGELAQGDIWYGARTRNPWKVDAGSSGSSAGPASATAAGARRLRDRKRDARLYLVAIKRVWHDWSASNLRPRSENWRDGTLVEHG